MKIAKLMMEKELEQIEEVARSTHSTPSPMDIACRMSSIPRITPSPICSTGQSDSNETNSGMPVIVNLGSPIDVEQCIPPYTLENVYNTLQ